MAPHKHLLKAALLVAALCVSTPAGASPDCCAKLAIALGNIRASEGNIIPVTHQIQPETLKIITELAAYIEFYYHPRMKELLDRGEPVNFTPLEVESVEALLQKVVAAYRAGDQAQGTILASTALETLKVLAQRYADDEDASNFIASVTKARELAGQVEPGTTPIRQTCNLAVQGQGQFIRQLADALRLRGQIIRNLGGANNAATGDAQGNYLLLQEFLAGLKSIGGAR